MPSTAGLALAAVDVLVLTVYYKLAITLRTNAFSSVCPLSSASFELHAQGCGPRPALDETLREDLTRPRGTSAAPAKAPMKRRTPRPA